ncbi:FecR family protein [Kordiimonas aestuarii]|uniref:FecR family protein n=1 Tax=Kordiimonas aestuarii TaxID=1005925 RepID=UPI0021CDF4F6|nr:FecR domain-containing protein [Kordiimonas aestuarii]
MAKNEIDNIAADWVARLDGGPLGANKQAELDAWLAADARHQGAYVRARAIWQHTNRVAAMSEGATRDDKPAPAQAASWGISGRMLAIAATLLVAVVGAGYFGFEHYDGRKMAEIGEVRLIAMNDGSAINLNTASVIQTRYDADERRILLREGEASFKVAHEDARPFVVAVDGLTVRAVGTHFSVRRLKGAVSVIVAEGIVEVANPTTGEIQRLHADEWLTAVAGQTFSTANLSANEISRRMAWEDGRLVFDGESVREATAEVNRYATVKILVEDPAMLDETLVGVFRIGDSKTYANSVAAAFDARLVEEENALRIVKK